MFKTVNVGSADRIVRIVLGLALIILPFVLQLPLWESAAAKWASIAIGAVLFATALVRFCPLYRLIGASTCKVAAK